MSSPGELKNIIVSVLCLAICLTIVSPAFALTADPMDLSVGARSLGMGRAYVAIAEDSETVFVNPAGLGAISTLKLSSMYTSLMDEVNYTAISGVYPMDNDGGTLGAGIINQSSTSIPLYNASGEAQGSGSFGNNVFFISQGMNLSKRAMPYTKNLYGGYTLKYFQKSATGWNTTGMGGYGFAADMGLLWKPEGAYSYGLSLQNILAGTMVYDGGNEDEIGSAMKVGTKVALMGDKTDSGALYQNDSRLDLAVDYNIGIRGKIPATLHMGAEYKPQVGVNYIDKILTLRAGIDQVPTPVGAMNNVTMGVGVNYQGVEFNYAYCPSFGDIPQSSTQYFSLSYVGVPTAVKPVEEMKPLIGQLMPDDKIVTADNAILVQGIVNDPANIMKVEINGAGVNVNRAGAFEMNVPLSKTGKHLIVVTATDLQGKTEDHKLRAVKLVKFSDVASNYWAVNPVQQLATVGLVEGYPNGTFQPERALSRAELATLLVKSKGIEPPVVTAKAFKDVALSHWATRYIKGALDMGLVTGYPDKTFRPNNKISRTEGVVVLTRFGELQQQAALQTGPYPDLTAKYWASPFIAAAREAGLLDYLGDKDFEPSKELTRAEAVEILSKTSYGSAKVESLLDWEVGFEPGTEKPAASASRPAEISSRASAYSQAYAKPTAASAVKMKEFFDVNDDLWASESIKNLATAGIMEGYPDGSFKPERIVTRAELSTILVKAKNVPVTKTYTTAYSDVSGTSTAAPYITAAVDSGYLTGRRTGKFEPNKGATRAEAVSAVVAFDSMELPGDLRVGPFPDMTARESASKYVAAAKEAGLLEYLKGQDFEADKSITRAELAELIAKTKFGQARIEQVRSAGIIE